MTVATKSTTKNGIQTFVRQMADVTKREGALAARYWADTLALKVEAGGILHAAYLNKLTIDGKNPADDKLNDLTYGQITKTLGIAKTGDNVFSRPFSTMQEDFNAYKHQAKHAAAIADLSKPDAKGNVVPITSARSVIVKARQLDTGATASTQSVNAAVASTLLEDVTTLAKHGKLSATRERAANAAMLGLPTIADLESYSLRDLDVLSAIIKGVRVTVKARGGKALDSDDAAADNATVKSVTAAEQSVGTSDADIRTKLLALLTA